MSLRATNVDVAALTVGGDNLLGTLQGCRYVLQTATVDGRPITRDAKAAQPVKRMARVTTTQSSVLVSPERVSHLDVTGLTIGGEDVRGDVRRLRLEAEFDHDEGSGVGDFWECPVMTERDFRARVELAIPVGGVPLLDATHGTADEGNVTLSAVINGVTIALPMTIRRVDHRLENGRVQTLVVDLVGRSPDSGNYPSSPTGTTSLLERALNQPRDLLTLVLTTRSDGGATYQGNFVWDGLAIDVRDGEIVATEYAWRSFGAVTALATVSV